MSDLYSGVEATGTPGMAGELGTAGERMTALAEGAPEITGVPGESGVSPNVTQNPVWKATSEEMQREARQRKRLETVEADFGFIGLLCLAFGVIGTFFLHKNPSGITFPLFVAMVYGFSWLILRRRGIQIKGGSWFLIGMSLLIGISTCMTADTTIHGFNKLALFLLFCVFVLHQRYRDGRWNIGKYMGAIFMFLCRALGFLGCPFSHGIRFLKSIRNKKYKNVVWVLAGICVAAPVAIILSILLATADRVFESVLDTVITEFLNPFTVIPVVFKIIFGIIAMYCLICSACAGEITEEVKDRRTAEPLIAIAFMALIGAVYLLFCGIQVVYLFMGRGQLPYGLTYAEYARQGFFQLLFVAVLNLVMVLLCLKYFRRSAVLNIVLLMISLCTYVMIASAFYRMILYVEQYHLTYLRLLVLWFLPVLAVLMAGVVALIFWNRFPLFWHCLGVISVCYLALAWMKPDYQIARYNLTAAGGDAVITDVYRDEAYSRDGVDYLSRLSADAAPAVAELMAESDGKQKLLAKYVFDYERSCGWGADIRTYNISFAKALDILNKNGQ